MNAEWCINYNGLVGRAGEDPRDRRCKAGVLYDSVRIRPDGLPGGGSIPCIASWDRGLSVCAERRFPTPEEVKASDELALARLTQHAQVVATGHCPHCAREMTSRKIGHCLYAEPCGHRLNEIPREIKGLEFVTEGTS